jgi:hypothetical protein
MKHGVRHAHFLTRGWLAALLWLVTASTIFAKDESCATCGVRLGTQVYLFAREGREDKASLCPSCAKLTTTCYLCNLPVKDKGMRLSDGRILCEEDSKAVVLKQEDAERIFDEAKRDVQSFLAQVGRLPHNNISLVLETKARLDKSGGNVISSHDDALLMGLTRTIGKGEGQFEHTIFLLYGLTHERMISVSAHEYAHTWLHENVQRKLNQLTVEGFCDYLAYKVIEPRSATEARTIYRSTYSHGQSRAFIAAEKEYGFYRVMAWVKNGLDPELDSEHLDRLLVLRENSSDRENDPAPAFTSLPGATRAIPTNLVLKGLSGSSARRFALINDGTFMANEKGKVRLFDSNVVLHCLAIRDDSVMIHVEGESEPRTLKLNARP